MTAAEIAEQDRLWAEIVRHRVERAEAWRAAEQAAEAMGRHFLDAFSRALKLEREHLRALERRPG